LLYEHEVSAKQVGNRDQFIFYQTV